MARNKWIWTTGLVVALLALAGGVWLAVAPARASSTSPYSQPRWWSKYQVVSANGFTPRAAPGATQSVTVGANVDMSNEPGPQSETSITINPSNPLNIVGGSNEIDRLPMRGYFSSDGGKTFGGVDLPLPPASTTNGTDFGSDPGVAFDTRGNVYYSYIVVFFNRFFDSVQGSEMAVAKSTDGGQTWPQVTFFNFTSGNGKFNDKPMIAVDTNPNSPFRDSVYVAWDNASPNQGKSSSNDALLFARSTDGGQTFSAPIALNALTGGPHAVIGADPFVGPNGEVYVAWHDVQGNRMMVNSSLDGGATFGQERAIAPTQSAFDIGIPAENVRRALVYPACDADRSAGAHRGALYCSWTDSTAANGSDVFVARSTDGAQTWGAPARVNDDPTGVANDQFNQWLAVDPTNGSVNVSWSDTRQDPTHASTNEEYTRSTDGGQSYIANVQVSTAPTNETCCGAQLHDQYGDYEGIAAYGGVARPVWTDRRDSVAALGEEVFTAAITAK